MGGRVGPNIDTNLSIQPHADKRLLFAHSQPCSSFYSPLAASSPPSRRSSRHVTVMRSAEHSGRCSDAPKPQHHTSTPSYTEVYVAACVSGKDRCRYRRYQPRVFLFFLSNLKVGKKLQEISCSSQAERQADRKNLKLL